MGAQLMPQLCHPDDLPKVFEHFEGLKKLPDGKIVSLEYRIRHRDGRWVWLLSHDTIFERDESGAVLRHLGSAIDITAQKTLEDNLRHEKTATEEANDELRSFAYAISHDLKSPSNTLAMLLAEFETTTQDRLDPDETELLTLCTQSVTRMQTLIEDVLHFTRVVGDADEKTTVDLDQVLSEVQDDLMQSITDSSAQIQANPLPTVQGYPTQLRILLQNLITNAIRYRRKDLPPKVTVLGEPDRAGACVTISVADNGIGIDPAMHDRIFKMFSRLHLEHEIEGTGLGLTICRKIATNHGGSIAVQSALGEGSTFLIRLPLR